MSEEKPVSRWADKPLSDESKRLVSGADALKADALRDSAINQLSYNNPMTNEPPVSAAISVNDTHQNDMGMSDEVPSYLREMPPISELDMEMSERIRAGDDIDIHIPTEMSAPIYAEQHTMPMASEQPTQTDVPQMSAGEPVTYSTLKDDPNAQVKIYVQAINSLERKYSNPKPAIIEAISTHLNIPPSDENDKTLESEYKALMGTVYSEVNNITMKYYNGSELDSNITPETQQMLIQNFDNQNIQKIATHKLHTEYNSAFVNDTLPKNEYGQPRSYQDMTKDIKTAFSDVSQRFDGRSHNLNSPFINVVKKDLAAAIKSGDTSAILHSANYNIDYRNALKDILETQFHERNLSGNKSLFGDIPKDLPKEQFVEKAVEYLNSHNQQNAPTLGVKLDEREKDGKKINVASVIGKGIAELSKLNKNGFNEAIDNIRQKLGGAVGKVLPAMGEEIKGKKPQKNETEGETLADKFNDNKEQNYRNNNNSGGVEWENNGLANAITALFRAAGALTIGVAKGVGIGCKVIAPNATEKTVSLAQKSFNATKNVLDTAEHKLKETLTTKEGALKTAEQVQEMTAKAAEKLKTAFKPTDDVKANPNPASSYTMPPKSPIVDLRQKYSELGAALYDIAESGSNSNYQASVDNLFKLDQASLRSNDINENEKFVQNLKAEHAKIFDSTGDNDTVISTEAVLGSRQQMDLLYDAVKSELKTHAAKSNSGAYNQLIEDVNGMRNTEYQHYVKRAKNPVEQTIAETTLASAKLATAVNNYEDLGGGEQKDEYRKKVVEAAKEYQAAKAKSGELMQAGVSSLVEQSGITDRDSLLNFGRNLSQLMTYEDDNLFTVKSSPKFTEILEQEPELSDLKDSPEQAEKNQKSAEELMETVKKLVEKLSTAFSNVVSTAAKRMGR